MMELTFGAVTMMQLGDFQFSINTAAYQSLKRKTEYRWESQNLFGQRESLQYTGPGSDTVNLDGAVYPAFRGGTGQIKALRAMAGTGVPLNMIDGLGAMMGRWVVESVDEGQEVFGASGIPFKQEFSLQLRKFDDGLVAKILDDATATAGGAADAASVGTEKSDIAKFADDVAKSAAEGAAKLGQAVNAVKAKAQEIGTAVAPVVASITRAVSTANQLRSAAVNLKNQLNSINSITNIPGVLSSTMSAASAASNASALAASQAKAVGINLAASGGDSSSVQTLKDATVASGQVAVSASASYGQAQGIIRKFTV